MSYVDGFVVAVPTANREAYQAIAQQASEIFRDHGATRCVECWGEDVPDGKQTSFPMAVRKQADETVVFSWIEWPDRETRDAGMAAAMKDSRMPQDPGAMPFDGKRMIFGGFTPIVDA